MKRVSRFPLSFENVIISKINHCGRRTWKSSRRYFMLMDDREMKIEGQDDGKNNNNIIFVMGS